ncbi:MAG: SDR family oxidoreductase [Parcubacteria group bacterium]|nr:SDR family oxidoreductase [Parcubacteria group bacterium]
MTKTILVTGCAGFIGSNLCEYLLANEDCRIVGIDNFLTGSRANIRNMLADKKFTFLEKDIIEPLYLEEDRIDHIYNLACPASPVHYQANPIRTIKVNTFGVINMLGLAKKHKARILQASTSEIYGDPLEHPQTETYKGNVNPIGPRACYDEGKRIAEALCFEYQRKHGVDIRVARIFNTYGPNMAENDGRVISNFIVQALAGESLTVYGKGEQTRSFCYVSDMVRGLYQLMQSDNAGPVNLGNPTELTILEIAGKIISLTRSDAEIIFQDLPADDPHRRKPDITLAERNLGWLPQVELEEGLKKTIDYFMGLHHN